MADKRPNADCDDAAPDTLPLGLTSEPSETAARSRNSLNTLSPALERQLMVLSTVWDATRDALMVTDERNAIVAVNPAFETVTGYAEHEVLGKNPSILASGSHTAAYYEAMWAQLNASGQWEGEILNRRKNGVVYPEQLRIQLLRDPGTGELLNHVATFADLSLQKAAQRKMQRMASYDQLTGLPNQVLLRDRAEQSMAQARSGGYQLAMLVLDLDHFKAVNDSLGHAGGDELLRQISRALVNVAAPTETVSRRGGDEFVFLLPRVEIHALRLIAQRVLVALADPFVVSGREAVVSASVGVAVYPTDGADFDAMLNSAESAMYKAKESGRRCVRFFTEQMNQGARDRMALLGGLTRAADRGELRLHYQPLVNLNSSEVIGAEALVRWERPGYGLLAPAHFIPEAETTGLIVGIGAWVLNEACVQQRRWADAGLGHLNMAVNVSALQFRQGILERQVAEALSESGADPKHLELELTESTLMVQPEEVMDTLQSLKQRGVQLAIDDFGTGYSSLAYLRRLAVDKIKIDQSFVRDITVYADGAAIVRAVIQMARSLGLRTLGEGVETQVNRRALQVLGCDYAQGYFFGKPMPADEFEQWVSRSHQTPLARR